MNKFHCSGISIVDVEQVNTNWHPKRDLTGFEFLVDPGNELVKNTCSLSLLISSTEAGVAFLKKLLITSTE